MDDHGTISLREFFDEKFKGIEQSIEAQRNHTTLRFDALDTALTLAREDSAIKFAHLNALRTEVTTDRGLLVARSACKYQHDDISTWRTLINEKLTVLETRSITWTAAVGIFFLLISILMRFYGK